MIQTGTRFRTCPSGGPLWESIGVLSEINEVPSPEFPSSRRCCSSTGIGPQLLVVELWLAADS